MKATKTLHDQGQSLWLDNITRDILRNGTLARYIRELSVTGLTSNPTIFDHAVKASTAYDAAIQQKVKDGRSGGRTRTVGRLGRLGVHQPMGYGGHEHGAAGAEESAWHRDREEDV